MEEKYFKLTLDAKATYQIKVPGEIKQLQNDADEIMIEIKIDNATGFAVTIFTSKFDQAGLHGFLRKLYSMGLPLLSLDCIGCR